MIDFMVVERHNPLLGLTHGVHRKGEGGAPICLCYSETQANLVAAALAAYAPGSMSEQIALPAPAAQPAHQVQEPQAKKPRETKVNKSAPKKKGR